MGYDGVDTLAGVSREWDPASVAALDGDSGDFSSSIDSAESALQPQFSSAGIIKPDIVFFHEDLPEVFYDTIQKDIEVRGIGVMNARPAARTLFPNLHRDSFALGMTIVIPLPGC